MRNVPIKEAAARLGLSEQSLRLWLQSTEHPCPFGNAWRGRGKGFTYYICEERLTAYLTAQDIKKG